MLLYVVGIDNKQNQWRI